MSTSEPTPEQQPNPPTPVVQTEAPPWATELSNLIRELPGKLVATVTEDDRKGVAQSVYDLFEKGGAFAHGETSTEQEVKETETEAEKVSTEEEKPTKSGKLSGFASWFEGK